MQWHHATLRDCKLPIGQGFLELDERGFVVSPTPYAEAVLRRYGSVTGFRLVPVTEETTEPEDTGAAPQEPLFEGTEAPASRRRGRSAKSRG